ncbi:GRIP and coiled-coil domain-containing protein 2-like [Drosophila obscura]|uniref:GRIP and coiled-coil domain-containing protein 2-like n=1 Tax=Drosophila obscura TaxID=7282 RepID=UPI001BB22AA6|nr:GRIP and coiled-coil domain-containing protein 2-like [Drosophila obscura]
MEAYKYKIELQMSDTSGQPGKSPAPEAKPEGREFLDDGSKEDLLADTQVIRRSLESQLDKLREEKRWAEQCNTQLEIDLDKIKKRYNALESDFEAMVLEKELKIHSLELAQIRCQQLEPENVSQQQYITQLEARQSTLENTNAQLNRHLNDIVAEMSSFKDILLKNNKSRVGFFCRDNTVTLKKQLEGRDKEMHLLIEQEHETLNTVATLYEEKTRLQLRIVKMEKELGAVKQNLAKTYSQLQQKINPLIAERDALRNRRQKADSQLKSIQLDMLQLSEENKHLKQECDRLKEAKASWWLPIRRWID